MSWLLEDPTPMLVATALIVGILTLALVKTGRGGFLYAIVGVAVLAGGLLTLEILVVTDKEEISDQLSAAATALESNDPRAVQTFIDPASPMYRQVASEMSRVKINSAGFKRLQVTLGRGPNPQTAEVRFIGHISAKDTRGEVPYENFIRPFTVQLKRESDRWLLTGYEIEGMPGERR